MYTNKLAAGTTFPEITLPTLSGESVALGAPHSDATWQLVVVYRGKHCPICHTYAKKLETLIDSFAETGVSVTAVSGDPQEKAQAFQADTGATFPIAYDLSIEHMQTLGLYISEPRSPEETDRPFAEPAVFLINEEGNIHIVDLSNAPFSRPDLEALVGGIKFIRDPENNYPIRGTHEG
ncbi:AhpC/TSA family protein [Candidatus Pacebacteria bacterium]|nr:AhpC/TSA family protein [Candidatus Paceibacterota bacterium]